MKNKKLVFGFLVVLVVVIAVLLVYKLALSPVIVEGVVGHKAVRGIEGNTHPLILVSTATTNLNPEVLVLDKDYEEFFPENGDLFINKSLEDKMETKYDKIEYFVSIRVSSKDPINGVEKGECNIYSVDRSEFNKVQVWDEVKYEVSRWYELPTIEKFVDVKIDRVDWVGLLFRVAEKDERVRKLIDGNPYRVVMGNRPSKNYGEEFVMVGGKTYKIAIYLNNETVKSVEEVKDQEQLRMIQKVIKLQNEINITVKPHEREKKWGTRNFEWVIAIYTYPKC